MSCKVIKITSSDGSASTSVIAECASLYEACDAAYQQPRNGSYGVIDDHGQVWSMAELIGGGFSTLCTKHEHTYWNSWLIGNLSGVAAPQNEGSTK